MMDCDTTGIEPDLGLVKLKKLVGGGNMHIVNQTVPRALKALGYSKQQIDKIIKYIDVEKTIVGAPDLKAEHLPVFACSMGDNSIHYMGHVKMMAAVQPFLSGAISKTVNLPEEATVEDMEELHIQAWQMGLKAVAVYRDNCKVGQPLSMAKKEGQEESETNKTEVVSTAPIETRRKLPKIRQAKTFSYKLSGSSGYVTVGEYDDSTPGEIFLRIAKQGSTLAGVMDALAISVSHGLQFGVPLKDYVKSFTNMSFTPAGLTDDDEIRTASSIVDYVFRRLALTYLPFDDLLELGLKSIDDAPVNQVSLLDEQVVKTEDKVEKKVETVINQRVYVEPTKNAYDDSAPLCFNCGNKTQRAGSCYVCSACGSTTGCS
jgi:ribonucleoside-diphosphate reductase alpha chain